MSEVSSTREPMVSVQLVMSVTYGKLYVITFYNTPDVCYCFLLLFCSNYYYC